MSDAKLPPGPWEVTSYLSRQLSCGWYVRRKVSLCSYEWMENERGRRKRFKSESAALAAIAKANAKCVRAGVAKASA